MSRQQTTELRDLRAWKSSRDVTDKKTDGAMSGARLLELRDCGRVYPLSLGRAGELLRVQTLTTSTAPADLLVGDDAQVAVELHPRELLAIAWLGCVELGCRTAGLVATRAHWGGLLRCSERTAGKALSRLQLCGLVVRAPRYRRLSEDLHLHRREPSLWTLAPDVRALLAGGRAAAAAADRLRIARHPENPSDSSESDTRARVSARRAVSPPAAGTSSQTAEAPEAVGPTPVPQRPVALLPRELHELKARLHQQASATVAAQVEAYKAAHETRYQARLAELGLDAPGPQATTAGLRDGRWAAAVARELGLTLAGAWVHVDAARSHPRGRGLAHCAVCALRDDGGVT